MHLIIIMSAGVPALFRGAKISIKGRGTCHFRCSCLSRIFRSRKNSRNSSLWSLLFCLEQKDSNGSPVTVMMSPLCRLPLPREGIYKTRWHWKDTNHNQSFAMIHLPQAFESQMAILTDLSKKEQRRTCPNLNLILFSSIIIYTLLCTFCVH